jgi:hypothetical protein
MRWYVYTAAAVGLSQLAIICLLAFKCRGLRRRLDEELRFGRRPPQSITEEGLFQLPGSTSDEPVLEESKFEAVRRAS